jgi:hypothetical protein
MAIKKAVSDSILQKNTLGRSVTLKQAQGLVGLYHEVLIIGPKYSADATKFCQINGIYHTAENSQVKMTLNHVCRTKQPCCFDFNFCCFDFNLDLTLQPSFMAVARRFYPK